MHSRHLYDDFIRRKPRRTSDGKQFSGTLRKCGPLRVQTSQYMYCLHFKTAVRKKQYTLPKIPRITPERQGQASHASICAAVKAFQADKYLVKIDGFFGTFSEEYENELFFFRIRVIMSGENPMRIGGKSRLVRNREGRLHGTFTKAFSRLYTGNSRPGPNGCFLS